MSGCPVYKGILLILILLIQGFWTSLLILKSNLSSDFPLEEMYSVHVYAYRITVLLSLYGLEETMLYSSLYLEYVIV